MLNRRDFLLSVGSVVALNGLSSTTLFAASSKADIEALYRRSMVIDGLGGPGEPFRHWPRAAREHLTDSEIADLVRSGVTACNVTVSTSGFDDTLGMLAAWRDEIDTRPEILRLIRNGNDLTLAKKNHQMGLILGFQHTEMIGRNMDRLDMFHRLGVRIIQLTYNKRNYIGNGCLEPGDGGLSRFGRKFVARLNELNVAVDLSHCGKQTTVDGIALCQSPPLITHSGCNAIHQHPRNKDDADMRAMADKGGVIGIYFMPFLADPEIPYATLDMALNHLDHAIKVCGADHVGIGSDNTITATVETPEYKSMMAQAEKSRAAAGVQAPGEAGHYPYMPDLNGPRKMETFAFAMSKRGHSDAVIEKVLGANFQRALSDIWG